jgi:predicted enzyme related to lactoylglutathione lyase
VVAVGALMEVILYVQDMGSQVSFYRDTLGLQVKEPQDVQDLSGQYCVELDTGACTLALHGGGQRRFGEDAPKIVFRVADVPRVRAELLQQGVPMGDLRSPAPGVQVCDGRDPEGNRFSIESRSP